MSKYHPINKEISVESMRYMRENEHMTNREIAERLGISVATVYNYLGKMPTELIREIRARAGSMGTKTRWGGVASDQRVPAPPQEEPDAVLLVTGRVIALKGESATYTINCGNSTVSCTIRDRVFQLNLDELPAIIAELSAIQRKCDALKMTTEMW